MKLALVKVACDRESAPLPADPLAAIEADVVSVAEHFIVRDGQPHLHLVVPHGADAPLAADATRRFRPVGQGRPKVAMQQKRHALEPAFDKERGELRRRNQRNRQQRCVVFAAAVGESRLWAGEDHGY